MRHAATDANQAEIVKAFRKLGASVQSLHSVGQGCPDLIVAVAGMNLLVEVKDGSKPPSGRRLTPDQVEWHDGWRGQVCIIKSLDQVTALVNRVRHFVALQETELP